LQLLAENLVLYAAGALLGVLLAAGAVQGFKAWNPLSALPSRGIELNLRTLGAAAGITLGTCIAFGVIPAFGATRLNLSQALRAGSRGIASARNSLRAQTWLVATQIAISLVLLGGCALLVSTLVNLERQSFGFQTESVETFRLALPNARYKDQQKSVQFQERLLDRLRATSGVSSAALGPIFGYGDLIQTPFAILNKPALDERDMPHAVITTISSRLFQSARIPVMRGSDFPDELSSASDGLAVINQRAAGLYFADSDAIGQYIRIGNPLNAKEASHSWLRIIGIVGDTRAVAYNHLAWDTHPEIYIDFRQSPAPKVSGPWGARNLSFVVATAPGNTTQPSDLQAAVWAVDPELPVAPAESLDSVVAKRLSQPRIRAQLLVVLAGISLLLTAIGIYGVLSESVASRRSEIAIRMAVGANRQRITRLVVGRSVMVALSGILAGTMIILGGARLLRSMVYGISAFNPIVYCSAAALLLIVAVLAAHLPARRAASVDPMSALRGD
jgi:putative ABC transport system permease protein